MSKEMSRRDLLKMSGLAAAGVAGASLLGRLRTESGIERIRFRQGGKRRLDRRNHRGRPRARRASELPERTRADQGRENH